MTEEDPRKTKLRKAGATYQHLRDEVEQARETLAEEARAAYASGMKKADILRAMNHAWTDRHLDTILKDVEPPATTVRRVRPARPT